MFSVLSIEPFYCALTSSNHHFESVSSLLKSLLQIIFTTRNRGGVVY